MEGEPDTPMSIPPDVDPQVSIIAAVLIWILLLCGPKSMLSCFLYWIAM